MKGARIFDATGQDGSIEVDLEATAGHKYHFVVFNRDVSFKPSDEYRLPIKEDKGFKGLVATISYEGLLQRFML